MFPFEESCLPQGQANPLCLKAAAPKNEVWSQWALPVQPKGVLTVKHQALCLRAASPGLGNTWRGWGFGKGGSSVPHNPPSKWPFAPGGLCCLEISRNPRRSSTATWRKATPDSFSMNTSLVFCSCYQIYAAVIRMLDTGPGDLGSNPHSTM